jgi:hypothetical protein
MDIKHEWTCDECGEVIPFRSPELPQDDYDSEQNESKNCPECGDDMYFSKVEELAPRPYIPMPVIELPDNTFYEPLEVGIQKIKELAANRTVVEIGAGSGELAKALRDEGLNLVAIDSNTRESAAKNGVVIFDAEIFPYPPGCTVLVARPCRGDWVERSLEQARTCGASKVIYIGKPYRSDEVPGSAELVAEECGEEGESMWTWELNVKKPGSKTFVLVGTKLPNGVLMKPFWMERVGNMLHNISGGRQPFVGDDEQCIHETVQADDFEDLDWDKTCWGKNVDLDRHHGWLSRDGDFYGCDYMGHDSLAYFALGKEVAELEKTGWIRVQYNEPLGGYHNGMKLRFSQAQSRFLKARGCDIRDEDVAQA